LAIYSSKIPINKEDQSAPNLNNRLDVEKNLFSYKVEESKAISHSTAR
jgi:hypothetical protein